jgi:hypothetical protein
MTACRPRIEQSAAAMADVDADRGSSGPSQGKRCKVATGGKDGALLISHFARRRRANFAPEKPAAPGLLCAVSNCTRLGQFLAAFVPLPCFALLSFAGLLARRSASALFPLSATIDDVNPTTPALAPSLYSSPPKQPPSSPPETTCPLLACPQVCLAASCTRPP